MCRSLSQDDSHDIRAHNFSILLHETYAGSHSMEKSFLLKQAKRSSLVLAQGVVR
jgi:hypothetical protein